MDDAGIGARTAQARKLKGWTQRRLANEAGLSESLVAKVECGALPASPTFLAAAARALGLEPEELSGAAPYSTNLAELPGVAEMRRIVAEWDCVEPLPAIPLEQLEAEAETLRRNHTRDKAPEVFAMLPGHIRRLYGALAEPNPAVGRLYSLLSSAYLLADRAATRVGLTALQSALLGRLTTLVEQADDPLYAALAQVQRGKLMMYHHSIALGLEAVQRGMDLVSGDTKGATAIRGYGNLSAGIISARGLGYDRAQDYLAEARRIATEDNDLDDPYLTTFGRTNIEFHTCAVELEAGDPGKAARYGSALTIPAGTSPARIGHHWQDTARAWLLTGEPTKSLHALNLARKVAPQQTRRHPSVRETLIGIAAAERRRDDSLSAFARWAGMTL